MCVQVNGKYCKGKFREWSKIAKLANIFSRNFPNWYTVGYFGNVTVSNVILLSTSLLAISWGHSATIVPA